jgi:hypothetical protein
MTTKNPQFCIITPTAYLEEYASQSAMHLVLGHLVDTDDTYANFYATRGEFKIMDNGAFELGESYAPDKLIQLGHVCGADAIVLPDYPFQNQMRTIRAAKELMDEVIGEGFQTFFAPQSETGDLEGWIEGYQWASDNDDIDIIGMSILGVPNAIPHIPKAYARVVMTQILIERGIFNFNKYHHYLGLNSGPKLEVPPLIDMGALDSIDSSNPVWMGILGHRYADNTDSYLAVSKVKHEVDFDYQMTTDQTTLDNIQTNIDMTLALFPPAQTEQTIHSRTTVMSGE